MQAGASQSSPAFLKRGFSQAGFAYAMISGVTPRRRVFSVVTRGITN